jgi:ATP-dependent RNA helicase DDX42
VTWITGGVAPRPLQSFAQAGFGPEIMVSIAKAGYEKPTGIQAQAWPILLRGRDVIGIAKTGSGKTAAFVLPGLVQLMDQPELQKNDGPIMVVLAPTRELAHQIFTESKKFAKGFGCKVGAVYGGMSKFEQFKVLKNGVEVVVASPGRLIDLIKMKGTNLGRCTYLVLDEADRMLDMGFEAQVRSIVKQVRPGRQTAMFSATFKRAVEGLARDLLTHPVRITVGSVGQANKDVQQFVHVCTSEEEKWLWLVDNLDNLLDQGQVLIFRGSRDDCDAMANKLKMAAYNCNALHGDKDQQERDGILTAFKSGVAPILIATDVASRGLDIRGIKNVVNFDVARDIDSHVHRIGRTGRAGDKGQAFTLVDTANKKNRSFAGDLVRNLEVSEQQVPPALLDFAKEDPKYVQRMSRRSADDRSGIGSGGGGGGGGGKRNAQRPSNLGGLGYDGRDAGKLADHRSQATGGGGGGGSMFGLDFQKASDGPQVVEAGGFIPSKKVQASALPVDGFKQAQKANSAFSIGSGGLVSSKSARDNASAASVAAAAQKALAAEREAEAEAEAAAPTSGGDWLAAARQEAATAPPARQLAVGGCVRLQGLHSELHNGKEGTTVSFDYAKGRWVVELDGGQMAVKPENLLPVAAGGGRKRRWD